MQGRGISSFGRGGLVFLLVALVYVLLVGIATFVTQESYLRERRLFTWVSSTIMLAGAFAAATNAYLNRVDRDGRGRWGRSGAWALLAALFLYFSADEHLEFHEAGGWLAPLVSRLLSVRISEYLGEGIVLMLYCVVAAVPLASIWWANRRRTDGASFMAAGVILLGFYFVFDHIVPEFVKLTALVEETFKLLGFSSLLVGMAALAHQRVLRLAVGRAAQAAGARGVAGLERAVRAPGAVAGARGGRRSEPEYAGGGE